MFFFFRLNFVLTKNRFGRRIGGDDEKSSIENVQRIFVKKIIEIEKRNLFFSSFVRNEINERRCEWRKAKALVSFRCVSFFFTCEEIRVFGYFLSLQKNGETIESVVSPSNFSNLDGFVVEKELKNIRLDAFSRCFFSP